MEIVALRAFRDNYIWLLHQNRRVVAVDPGDEAPVLDFLARTGSSLAAILLTHHHADHTGGVDGLLAHHATPVFGPASEAIAGVTVPLRGGDRVDVAQLGATFQVIEVAGHTRGHVAYYGPNVSSCGALFCGDALFGCGCGRLFEGTAQQMWESLARLAALPKETAVYCAHEYTQANIAFALALEPDNAALRARSGRVASLREADLPSVPSTLAEELATNPFLRCREPAVVHAAERHGNTTLAGEPEVFATLREWKNNF